MSSRVSPTEERFSSYYESWHQKLELLLQHLVLGREHDYNIVVSALTAHHKEYYTAKWAAAREDVLPFFAATHWLNPLEEAAHWVTGWKPAAAFRLVDSLRRTRAPLTSLAQMADSQVRRIADLRTKIRAEEERVEREMERQQSALGDRRVVEVARRGRQADRREEEEVVKGLVEGLERVMKMADYVRLKTLKGLLEVLSPKQGVDFLAMFAMLEIQMRKWGKLKPITTTSIASTGSTSSSDGVVVASSMSDVS